MNTVNIIGNLTADPKKVNEQVVNFSIAVSRKYKDKEEVSFFNCTAFGKTGDVIMRYMSKGKKIGVTGRLQQQRWEKNGQKNSMVKIIAEQIDLLSPRESQPGTQSQTVTYPNQTNQESSLDPQEMFGGEYMDHSEY